MISKAEKKLILAIYLIAFLVRFIPYNNELMVSNDNQLVTRAFELAQGFSRFDFHALAQPTKYPSLFSYFLAGVFGVTFLVWKLAGLIPSVQAFQELFLLHPQWLYIFVNFIFAAVTALTPVLVYLTLRKLLPAGKINRRYAVLASLTATFSLLLVQYSHQPRPHAVAGTFLLLAYLLLLRYREQPTLKNAALLGVGSGLAAGMLQIGLISIIFILVAPWLHGSPSAVAEPRPSRRLMMAVKLFVDKRSGRAQQVLVSLVIFMAVFLLAYPHLALSPQATFNSPAGLDYTLSGHQHPNMPFTGERFGIILAAFALYEPIMILMVLAIIAALIYNPPPPRVYLPAGIGVAYVLIFGMLSIGTPRMLVSAVPFFIIAGALSTSFLSLTDRRVAAIALAIWALPLIFSVIQTGRLLQSMSRPTTKALASRYIKTVVPPTDTIAFCCDWFYDISPTRESIHRHQSIRPSTVSNRDALIEKMNLDIPDGKNIFRYWLLVSDDADPLPVIKAQSIRYYVFSLSAPSVLTRKDYQYIKTRGKLIKAFNPSSPGAAINTFDFPDDFRNPVYELWRLNQFGPPIEIYSLE